MRAKVILQYPLYFSLMDIVINLLCHSIPCTTIKLSLDLVIPISLSFFFQNTILSPLQEL